LPPAPNPNFTIPAYPQPWLTDLDFDSAGNMIIGLRDRYGDQMGNGAQSDPTSAQLYVGSASGDVLRACVAGASWALESNASCGGATSAGAGTGTGPGGGEFYYQDDLPSGNPAIPAPHDELNAGALLALPGAPDMIATTVDPVYLPNQFFDTGFRWFNNTTGSTTRAYRILDGAYQDVRSFGKGNGLGDIIALCEAAPVEIGNRVWYDLNRDGIQDPNTEERPLPGVVVELFDPASGRVIGQATTDQNGNYYFSNAPGQSSASALYGLPIAFGGTYTVRINLTQQVISGPDYRVTVANTGGGLDTDINDSDGLVAGIYDQVTFVVGQAGENNHTYDFGFSPAPTAITLDSFTARHSAGHVQIDWTTGSEIDTFGFHVYRGERADGSDAQVITMALIPATGRGRGASYQFLDDNIRVGATYYYWLEEVETNGVKRRYGPASTAPTPGADTNYFVYLPALQP
jgi:hypothetical protein